MFQEVGGGGGWGALPFMGYSEIFCCEGLSFQAVQSGIKGKERKQVMVWNKNTLWETDQLYEELEILCWHLRPVFMEVGRYARLGR